MLMVSILIKIKNYVILILSIFFLIIGINTLLGSFSLKNPLEFVMYFFSSCLLILFCIVGVIYFYFRMISRKYKNGADNAEKK
jgi:hypothetical protein